MRKKKNNNRVRRFPGDKKPAASVSKHKMFYEAKLMKDTFDISEYILGSAKVVTVPGDGFGAQGHIRFSYATSTKIIRDGIKRVSTALKKLKNKEE